MKIKKFQEGGMAPEAAAAQDPAMAQGAPAEGAAPAGAEGGDPIMQIAQVAAQAVQSQDCEAAMAVCQAFLELVQGQGGEAAPAEEAPQGEPVFKCGGKVKGRVKKACGGIKALKGAKVMGKPKSDPRRDDAPKSK